MDGSEDTLPASIARAREGDRDAYAEVVRAYQARLRAQVALTVADREAILSIVQDAFVDAWRGLATYDGERPFLPWLRAILRTCIAKHYREQRVQRRHLALVDAALLSQPCEDAPVEDAAERLAALRRCLAEVPAGSRELLSLRFEQDWQVKRIAEHLHKSANAVSMSLLRLKEELSACAQRRLQGRRS